VCITILIIYYTILCTFSSKDGNTSLLVASRNGHLAVVKELIDKNANIKAKDKVRHMQMMEIFHTYSTRCIDHHLLIYA